MSVELVPRGPYDLQQATRFGFGPVRPGPDEVLRLAFAADGDGAPAGVEVRQERRDGPVVLELRGDAPEEVAAAQVARILSLDADGEAWAALEDPLLRRLQARFPGLRPVLFHSPYEAACWAVISTRWGREQAARVRDAIAAAHGRGFKLAGEVMHAWPAPELLLAALDEERVLGLPGEKLRRLHGVAAAAQEGWLSAAHLHGLGPDAAADAVGELRGFGPFYRMLVTVRAVGFTDALAAEEPMVRRAAAVLYGSGELDAGRFTELAEAWRPFRTWASVLLRVAAERDGL